MRESDETPELGETGPERLDDIDRKLDTNFRYSDSGLNAEIRTSQESQSLLDNRVVAEAFKRDGGVETIGTARYKLNDQAALIHRESFNGGGRYGVESALLSEMSERARAGGCDRMQVWVPDDRDNGNRWWLSHGFQPTERNPGAPGVLWERPI